MRKFLLDIHLYLGLAFAPYFVVYGLSTLALNHGWTSGTTVTTTTRTVVTPHDVGDKEIAEASREQLGIWGEVSPWHVRRVDDGRLEFSVRHPGRFYGVVLDTTSGHATITEEDMGFWMVIMELHGYRGYSGSIWATAWRIYSEVSIWALFFSAVSGVYFWAARPAPARRRLWVLTAGTVGAVAMIVYMVI